MRCCAHLARALLLLSICSIVVQCNRLRVRWGAELTQYLKDKFPFKSSIFVVCSLRLVHLLSYSPSLEGKYSVHGPRMERSAELSRSIFVCASHQSLSRLVRSSVARSAEISRSIFVCASERVWCEIAWRGALRSRVVYLFVPRSTDVIGMRGFWRDFFVNAQKWREKSSLL